MLCIIFTKQKMFAWAHIESVFALPLGPQNYAERQSPALSLLKTKLPHIIKLYRDCYEESYRDPEPVIPVALIFSLSCDAGERKEAAQWMQQGSTEVRLIHISNPASSFLYRLFSGQSPRIGGYAVLEAFDDIVNLSFHYQKDGKAIDQYLPVAGLGWHPGRENILSYLIDKLKENGLELNKEGKEVLRASILNYKEGQPFKVSRQSGLVKINAEISLEPEKFNDLLFQNRREIKSVFSYEKMKLLNIYNVILMGNYFNNNVLQNYFSSEGELNKLTIRQALNDEKALEMAAEGALLRIAHLLESEKRIQLEARQAQLSSRSQLLKEVREVCNDEAQIEAYKANFIPRAEKLGIPRKIVLWHIRENLQKIKVSNQLATLDIDPSFVAKRENPLKFQKNDLPSVDSANFPEKSVETNNENDGEEVEEPIRESTFSVPPIHPELENSPVSGQALIEDNSSAFPLRPVKGTGGNTRLRSTTAESSPTKSFFEAGNFPLLLSYFTIEKVYTDNPFIYFKGRLRGNKGHKVIRFATSRHLTDPMQAREFRKIYDWESGYYEKISTVYTTAEGKYYYRDFIEGKKIAGYIAEKEINKKRSITEFNSQELQLLRLIFGEINGLKFACKNFNQDNFIVTSKLKWNLQKELGIKIVNFPFEEGTPEQMFASVNAVLTSLLGEKVYAEFLEKFKL